MQPTDPASENITPPAQQASAGLRLLGVPVRLHFTFLIFVVFLVASGAARGQSAFLHAMYILALFASVLLHEFGHVAVSRRYGIKTLEVVLYPIGGVARLERMPGAREELWIALAGPAVNLLIFAAIFSYLIGTSKSVNPQDLVNSADTSLLARIAAGNLVLAAFNMIPAFPMDGGRVLRAVLARFMPEDEATRKAAAAGRVLAVAMLLYGLLSGNVMLIFIAIFVYFGAAQESAAVTGKNLTQGVPVSSAMITDYRTLNHGDSLRSAANLLLATSQEDFPVMHADQVVGLLTRNALLRGIASDGADSYVAGYMDRAFIRMTPDTDLAEALGTVLSARTPALVMDGERLLGLLTRENLSEFLLLRRSGLEAPRGV